MEKVAFLGIQVSLTDVPQLIGHVVRSVKEGLSPQQINYLNVHTCYLALHDPEFKDILNQSELVFCDGFGVKLGARLQGLRLGSRMTPPDWIDRLLAACAEQGISVFFLGDEEPVVRLFTQKVQEAFPALRVAGFHHGFFARESEGNEKVIRLINRSGAQVLITGLGQPLQEKWAFHNRHRLQVNSVLATGAMFRWYAQVEKRGPRLFTDHGLEWLWRLMVQPGKVWKRYLVELPYFGGVVVKNVVRKKFRRS